MAEMTQKARRLRFCFGLSCAGALMIDPKRLQKLCRIVAKMPRSHLQFWDLKKAVLATRPKRSGNEFLFQMQASTIEVLNGYEAKKIVTACPHCFNTLKNEYPQLGGHYEVLHHTQFLHQLIEEGR